MTRAERNEFWKQQVDEYAASGMSVRSYCQQQGIKEHQLGYWLRKQRHISVAGDGDAGGNGGWLPLRVVDGLAEAKSRGVCLRIGRVELMVERGFDAELLTAVLRVAGAAC
jgi:transposase